MNRAGDIADSAVSKIEQSFANLNPTFGGFASLGVGIAMVTVCDQSRKYLGHRRGITKQKGNPTLEKTLWRVHRNAALRALSEHESGSGSQPPHSEGCNVEESYHGEVRTDHSCTLGTTGVHDQYPVSAGLRSSAVGVRRKPAFRSTQSAPATYADFGSWRHRSNAGRADAAGMRRRST